MARAFNIVGGTCELSTCELSTVRSNEGEIDDLFVILMYTLFIVISLIYTISVSGFLGRVTDISLTYGNYILTLIVQTGNHCNLTLIWVTAVTRLLDRVTLKWSDFLE